MDWLKLAGDLGSAAGVVVVVSMFLRATADERRLDRETWVNHLSKTVEMQSKQIENQARTAGALDLIANELRRISERLK
ncbi:MAG: hypothetical protein ACREBU_17155 [Nitrososphaera sp.]